MEHTNESEPNFRALESYEKEEIFAEELWSVIERFVKEYRMSYPQVVGVLSLVTATYIKESLEDKREHDGEI